MALSYDDLRTLSILAAEKADDSSIPIRERERWADLAERVMDGSGSANDLKACAELAELDAALQPDAKVRQRYIALARRAVTAS